MHVRPGVEPNTLRAKFGGQAKNTKVAEIGHPAIALEPPRGSREDSGQKWPERLCSSETSLPTPRFSGTRTRLDTRGLDYSRRPAGFCIYIPTLGSVDLAILVRVCFARACFARIASGPAK